MCRKKETKLRAVRKPYTPCPSIRCHLGHNEASQAVLWEDCLLDFLMRNLNVSVQTRALHSKALSRQGCKTRACFYLFMPEQLWRALTLLSSVPVFMINDMTTLYASHTFCFHYFYYTLEHYQTDSRYILSRTVSVFNLSLIKLLNK